MGQRNKNIHVINNQNVSNAFRLAKLTAEYGDGDTITSIAVTSTAIALKSGDVIMVAGQSLTLNADEAAGSTALVVSSVTLDQTLTFNDSVEIDKDNLFVQYQRKSAGTIGGMPVDSDSFGPLEYKGGVYYITGVDPIYMKILPRDFMVNDDSSASNLPPAVFSDGSITGVHVEDTDQELIATVNIPYGTTATEVAIWASNTTKDVEVYEMDIIGIGKGCDLGSGTTNGRAIDISDTASTTTNYLMIIVKVSNTNHRVWGGSVTLTQN